MGVLRGGACNSYFGELCESIGGRGRSYNRKGAEIGGGVLQIELAAGRPQIERIWGAGGGEGQGCKTGEGPKDVEGSLRRKGGT